MKIKIVLISLIVMLSIGGLFYRDSKSENTVRIGVLSETASLPILDAYDQGLLDHLEFPVEVIVYSTENAMLYDARIGFLDGFLCEPSSFIVAHKTLSDFVIISSTYKELYLIGSEKNNTATKLSDVKAAAMGIYNYNQCEFFLDLTIQSQNTIGISMDEVLVNDALSRVKLLEDNTLDFGIFTSPYSDYLLNHNAKLIQKMSGLNPSYAILTINKFYESAHIDFVEQFLSKLNSSSEAKTLKHYNALIEKYFNISEQIQLSKLPIKTSFELPNMDDMDILLSWLYNTERIPSKFKYADLVTDLISIKSH
ncbi:substrate-binding domain-containing protein [Fusibacter ferrireducens]|uniref:SsuA/THI5-like domain-containing protein n=1 Tax=Fusibacter ferrireducens TaxID=2785058 RepID=A0ABR9ZMG4_9FIRM|nr:hypothetical protein [Fusibacter ferrireducens]MBF4691663.1 hypothetical protein [Fusibacter ferrireducens]